MTSIEKIRKYIRTELSRLDREIADVRARAEAAEFDDLQEGLLQRAEDLDGERQALERIIDELPARRGE
jgi:hypothetical protein